MAENRVIGMEGRLPWSLPADLRRFKRLTTGNTVIMGRKTYESIGRPLPNRRNVVLTRNPRFQPDGVEVVSTLAGAIDQRTSGRIAFVIGGAEVYRAALPLANVIHLTIVHEVIEGDTRFPRLDMSEWTQSASTYRAADAHNRFPLSFRRYTRS